nr:uncharacterized protein LOC119625136 [Chlorocebus sabaeus]
MFTIVNGRLWESWKDNSDNLKPRKAEGGLLQSIYLCQFLIQGPGAGASVLPVLALGSRNALNPHFSQGLRPTYLGLSPGVSGWRERSCALEHRAGEEGEKPSWRLRGEGRAFPSSLTPAILTLREGVSPNAPRPPLRLPPPHRAAPKSPPSARASVERRRPWSSPAGPLVRCRSISGLREATVPLRLPPWRPWIALPILSLTPPLLPPHILRPLRTRTICWLKSLGLNPAKDFGSRILPPREVRAPGEVWGLPPPAGLADVRFCFHGAQQCSKCNVWKVKKSLWMTM